MTKLKIQTLYALLLLSSVPLHYSTKDVPDINDHILIHFRGFLRLQVVHNFFQDFLLSGIFTRIFLSSPL